MLNRAMDPSNPREHPWAEHEKVYLLAEILKAHPIQSNLLYGLIRDANIQPRWNDTALPPGRSVRSSQMAFENIAMAASAAPGQDYRRPQLPVPTMYPNPEANKKRPLQQEGPSSAPIGRLLQPRPPHPYPGEYIPAGPTYMSITNPPGEPANKKKRGRPTKAEAQQRAREAEARGEPYPPLRRGRQSITGPIGISPLSSDPRPVERSTPPPAPSQLPPVRTPQHQTSVEQASESSSGKRRRAKPQPLDLEKHSAPGDLGSPLPYGTSDFRPTQGYTYTPISAPLASSTGSRDRDTRMEGVEETQPRTTTPHSFKDTVGI
ncbi:hypothetical protein GMOD_00001074 [Pyrenophora seminiperda CCB06]|uniref:Uncharacterized protein n=1 Tax=Pyrenophora seminiperda CCB06 TaxID=1302712 RepID=A0A3M7LY47_9PLEO|nr:hypothetical protein GMOD_00001074 [Pyrenophora seminiperda CCB06]